MISEYIVYGLTTVGLMGFAYWQGYARAERRQEDKAPYGIERMILEASDKAPEGSTLIISYPRFLTKEQRVAIREGAASKVGEHMKVMILEGGLKAQKVGPQFSRDLSQRLMQLFADRLMSEETAKAKVSSGEMSVNDYRRGLAAREAGIPLDIQPLTEWPKK